MSEPRPLVHRACVIDTQCEFRHNPGHAGNIENILKEYQRTNSLDKLLVDLFDKYLKGGYRIDDLPTDGAKRYYQQKVQQQQGGKQQQGSQK